MHFQIHEEKPCIFCDLKTAIVSWMHASFFRANKKRDFKHRRVKKPDRNTAWIKHNRDYAESQYARLTVGVIPRCQYTKHFSESWANSVWTVWFENQVQLSFKSSVNCHPNIWGSQFISSRIRFWKLSSIFPSGN